MPDGTPIDLEAATELVSAALSEKPRLLIEHSEPAATADRLRDILVSTGRVFDRGAPVRLVHDHTHGGTVVQPLTAELVVREAHHACQPYVIRHRKEGPDRVNVQLPRPIATMYLDMRGEWNLKPLHGIASAPLLHNDGSFHHADGYDDATGMWCENVPDLAGMVPERPTRAQAERALLLIRSTFATFCFADADMVTHPGSPVPLVDLARPPGKDESGFLVGLLTAICRPSLDLAPAALIRAAPMSGSGTGKGLLARCICLIAFGREPHAVTASAKAEEMEKRISAELIDGSPTLFLDNMNNIAFKSDLLASVITERPARVRILGESRMVALSATAFIIMTGNGLTVSEDLARRAIEIELDARTEDPETRSFSNDIRKDVQCRRAELLAAGLTIWRWGRQAGTLKAGRPIGSFGQWCQWVRDPLIALGCSDPAERSSEAKANDPRRREIADLFATWWQHHDNLPIAQKDLHDDIRAIADPQNHGRQFLATYLDRKCGTRIGGFLLTRQRPSGKWGHSTYALSKVDETPPTLTPAAPCPNAQATQTTDRSNRTSKSSASNGHAPPPMRHPPSPETGRDEMVI